MVIGIDFPLYMICGVFLSFTAFNTLLCILSVCTMMFYINFTSDHVDLVFFGILLFIWVCCSFEEFFVLYLFEHPIGLNFSSLFINII